MIAHTLYAAAQTDGFENEEGDAVERAATVPAPASESKHPAVSTTANSKKKK